jgi:hypothetical protein
MTRGSSCNTYYNQDLHNVALNESGSFQLPVRPRSIRPGK